MQDQNKTFLFVDGFFCILYCIFAAIVINFGDANAVVDGEAKSHFTIYNHGSMSAGGTLVISLVPFILLRAAIDFWEVSERANDYTKNVRDALVKALDVDSKERSVESQPLTSVVKTGSGKKSSAEEQMTIASIKKDIVGTYNAGNGIEEAYNKPNRNEQNIWRNQITGIAIILCGLLLGVVTTYKHIADSPHEFGLCLGDDGVTKLDVTSQKCKDDIKALFKSSIIFHEDFKQCPAGGAARWEGEDFEDYVSLGLTHRLTNSETHTPWERCYQGLKQENKTQSCDLLSKPGNKKMKADQTAIIADPILVECQPIVWSRNADAGKTLRKQSYMGTDRPVAVNYHPKMTERCTVNQECAKIIDANDGTETQLNRLVTGAEVAGSAEETLARAKREDIAARANPYVCLDRIGAPGTNPTDGTQCIAGANLHLYNPTGSEAYLFNVSRPYGSDDEDDKREMDWALDTTLAQLVFFVVLAFRGLDLIIDFEFSGCLQSQRNAYLNDDGTDNIIAPRLKDGIGAGSRIGIIIVFLVITLGTLIHGRYQIINENIFIAYEGWDPTRAVGKPETIALHFNGDTFSGLNWAVIILVGCHLLLAVLAAYADTANKSGLEIFLITQKPFVRSFIATVILSLLSVNVGQMAVFNHEITFLACALVAYYIVDSVGANFL